MSTLTLTKTYNEPDFNIKEILRYAACKSDDGEISVLVNEIISEVRKKLVYKVCFQEFPVLIKNDVSDFESFNIKSKNLADNLKDCKSVIIFAATTGIELDRLIAKYSVISPTKALILDAIGTERIESLCDIFCKDIAEKKNATLKPRFSSGYGDLPLETQKTIFNLLDCSKNIGLSLNDSLLMSPSKSVTAFVGVKK